MKKSKQPTVTVIVLNYNGKRLIKEVLDKLSELNYPKDKYTVVVVDNNSTDGSQEIIKNYIKTHKQIGYLPSELNGGFAYGNNIAISKANSKYVALLNNDCLVSKDWLIELTKIAEKNNKIFAVNSKIILYPKHTYLAVQASTLNSVEVLNSKLFDYQAQKSLPLRWETRGNECIVSVPFAPTDSVITIRFRIASNINNQSSLVVKPLGSNNTYIANRSKDGSYELELDVNKLSKYKYNLVQNAGSFIFQDGYGRDIGASVVPGIQDYEIDKGQYDKVREVFSCCAASCLYRKSILDKIGSLDESFFMYYEDTELSWRARIFGYMNVTAPKSITRHFHSLSSGEWSPFFISHVEYGRLLCLLYSAPQRIYIKELVKFTIRSTGQVLRYLIRGNKNDLLNIQTLWRFVANIPKNIINKRKKYKKLKAYSKKCNEVYQQITEGRWYFQ